MGELDRHTTRTSTEVCVIVETSKKGINMNEEFKTDVVAIGVSEDGYIIFEFDNPKRQVLFDPESALLMASKVAELCLMISMD